MNILDEDIPEDQYQRLKSWRIPARRIGVDHGRLGMKDQEILPLLHSLSRPTFFTLDHGFFRRRFCHAKHCLIYLDVEENDVAESIRRTLRHDTLNTRNKRMGAVVRVRPVGLTIWRLHVKKPARVEWQD